MPRKSGQEGRGFSAGSWSRIAIVCLGIGCLGARTNPLPRADLVQTLPRSIRVLVVDEIDARAVRGIDLRIYQRAQDRVRGLAGTASEELSARRDEVSLSRAAGSGVTEWRVRCSGQSVELRSGKNWMRLRAPASIESRAGFLRFDGRPFRETLWFYPSRKQGWGCEVVNEVDVEEYLDGLVNSEFSARWSQEAIAAQVVAARTYALHQILAARLRGSHYDVHGTEKDQVYEGAAKEHFISSRVVDRTRGMVLTARGGKPAPIKAFYHSTCGGYTELPELVWGVRQPGFKNRVNCPYCLSSPRYRWDLEVDGAEVEASLRRKLSKKESWLSQARLEEIRSGPGRAATLRTLWRIGRHAGAVSRELDVQASDFRNWIGTSRLRSTAFTATRTASGSFRFSGRGNGHGVGMCQWGAKVMGEKGYRMAAILKFYYPDAELKKLW